MVGLWLPQTPRLETVPRRHSRLGGQLRLGAVFVQPRHGEPAVGGISGALFMAIRQLVLHGLPTTRMRTSLAACFCKARPCPVNIFPLIGEQILAFHARLARHAADQQRPIHPAESLRRSAVAITFSQHGGGAILQFEDHPAHHRHHRLNVYQMEHQRLVVSEDLARGEPEKDGVPDGPGRAGDRNMKRTFVCVHKFA
jgi:hypothetical protein